MATTLVGWQASALPAARALMPAHVPAPIPARLPAIAAYDVPVRPSDNFIGAPALAEGAATPAMSQRLDADKVKGFNARGNPPRGRRRV